MLYRIIDVNLNRARESTRVIEDYARFVLNDKPLYQSARAIRHQLIALTRPLAPDIISARNIETDIGKANKVTAKTTAEVIVSNLRRLQESLRSIIEYLKTGHPALSRRIEPLRFQAYQLEQEFHYILYPNKQLTESRLYVLFPNVIASGPASAGTRGNLIKTTITALLKGGADIIQLRAKGIEDGKLLELAKTVRRITAKYHRLFIMNDRVDIAYLSNADGVHLGETDISIREARQILGPDKIIGVTSHNLKEALQAQKEGADYISVGPFYHTPTKPGLKPAGFDYLKDVVKHIRIPYFPIGGINKDNIAELKRCHKRLTKQPLRVAVSSGILSQSDILKSARQIRQSL